MNKFLITLILTAFLVGCVGNPWEQFLGNIQMFVGENFQTLKKELRHGGISELTENGGYLLPNGNIQHEFLWWWSNKKGLRCILLIEESQETHKVVVVGGKGDTIACRWGG